jgi:hypothetical protein
MDEVNVPPSAVTQSGVTTVRNEVVFIELLDKHEALVGRHRFDRLPITLGTAYSNDYIIDADSDADPKSSTRSESLIVDRDDTGALVLASAVEGDRGRFWAPGGLTRRWLVNPDQSVLVGGQRLRIRTDAYAQRRRCLAC